MVKYPIRKRWEREDGWNSLIEELIQQIAILLDDVPFDVEVVQIKEKFGRLAFYTDGASDNIHNVIYYYEEKSTTVCEICGEEGKYRSDLSWKRTLCDFHYKDALRQKYHA